jgi:hypothetical protein
MQFNNRTQHEIEVGNTGVEKGAQFEEERQEMLAKVNYEEDESVYEKLEKTSDNSKFKYILVFFLIAGVFIGYFTGRYIVNTQTITQTHQDIQNLKMIS